MSDKDGGQAFPVSLFPGPMGDLHAGEPGMTLRDWFAGQALAGLMANGFAMQSAYEENVAPSIFGAELVRLSYQAADTMLAERTKP